MSGAIYVIYRFHFFGQLLEQKAKVRVAEQDALLRLLLRKTHRCFESRSATLDPSVNGLA